MRGLALFVLVASALVACGTGSAQDRPATALTVTYWDQGIGNVEPDRWTLRCNPAGGTLARPGLACRRLAQVGTRPFRPVRPSEICTQIYGGPQVARVAGTVAGKRVWATFSRKDGCQISRWNALAPWLLPPGGATR